MLEIFISVFVFIRHHSFDASPLILLMSMLWVVAGTILLLSPQIGSPYFITNYIYESIMSMLFIKETYFFPDEASLLFLLVPILDFLPLLVIILIRFFTPRPPNTFISVLCYLTQIFLFIWLEGFGPHTFYKLSGSLALLLKHIFETIATEGFFPAIFSLNSLALIYYSVLAVFHYQINLSFMYAQNTAAIKETKLFFAPSFIPLQRFRLLYFISLSIQQLFENVAFSIYFVYCTLIFINAYLIAARGSLSHVHNGPWVTLFLSIFLLFYSCYNIMITLIPMTLTKYIGYGFLLLICLPLSLIVSIGITITLLLLGKRTRINIINEYKQIKVRRFSCFHNRSNCFTIRILSTTPAKNLKIKVLTTDDHSYTTRSSNNTANNGILRKQEKSAKEAQSMPKDTALLLDPTTIQKYTLHTPLSRYMVMILAFYFDIHTVVSFTLPNDYTFTSDDINKLVYFIKGSKSNRSLQEEQITEERLIPYSFDLLSPASRPHGSMGNLSSSSSTFTKSAVNLSNATRPRSFSTTHRNTTLMKSSFTVPDRNSISKRNISKVNQLMDSMRSLQNQQKFTDTDTGIGQFNQSDQSVYLTNLPPYCYKSSDDTLVCQSTILSADDPNLHFLSGGVPNTTFPSKGCVKFGASSTPKTSCGTPNGSLLTPNQRIFKDFLDALDPQKIFKYVAQAEALLEKFKLFYENIYASLFLSYCAASQTLESVTLLDIEECLPIPLLLRYLRAWKGPGDAYNSVIYYIDQLKSIDDLKREYQATRATRQEQEHVSSSPNATRDVTAKTIFVELKKLPSFTCRASCTNCPQCKIYVTCSNCHTKIAILLKSTFNIVMGREHANAIPFRGFNCPDCNQLYLLKIVDSISKRKAKKKLDKQLNNVSVRPRVLRNYVAFLNRLTPLGKRIQAPTAYFRKKIPVVNFLESKTTPEKPKDKIPSPPQQSRCSTRRDVQLLLKSYINNIKNHLNEQCPIGCEWATDVYVPTKNTQQSNTDAKNQPNIKTDSKKFSRDRNIGFLHKSYSVISPQNFNGSIYFLSPELFVDVAASDESKSFLYNCRKQNCLFTVFLPTVTSTSSTTGNIHRLSFAYDREASLTSPLRILRMKVLIHLARMLFPINLYVDTIYPIQLVPCYKFYTLGSSYIENATNRVRMIYSPEFVLERQEDSEVRVVSRQTNVRKTARAMYRQGPLYLYCLAQNALTVKTQDKMDSSILQFVNVEYLFMQIAFTGIGNPYLSFFYRLYYTNNVSFFAHLLSLSKRPNSSSNNSSADMTAKLNKHGPSLSTVSGSIAINAMSISLNCHTLSDQTADAYAVIDRLLGGMYSVHLPIYTWLEMIKIRLSTCLIYLELLHAHNHDIFSKFEPVPALNNSRSFTLEMSNIPSTQSGLDLNMDEKKKDEAENSSAKLDEQDKNHIRHGHSFNVHTVDDYHELHSTISHLLSTCQSLLDKQMNEMGFINESHEIHTMKLLDDCSQFFTNYYMVSTQYLLHVTFDLPGLVGYNPHSVQNKPIYRYRNGVAQLITNPRERFIHLNDFHNPGMMGSNTKEMENQPDSNDFHFTLSNQKYDNYDSDSNLQDSSATLLADSSLPIADCFDKLFIPQLPNMSTSCYPKTMAISKKQILSNLFAIYEHVILENDVLETILLNNITVNGLPSIDINNTPFSLLSLLGRSSSRCVDCSLPRNPDDAHHNCTGTASIDAVQLQNLLISHAQELAKEKYIDELMQYFNSQSLYEEIGFKNYARVSISRLRQIILSLITVNTSAGQSNELVDTNTSSIDTLLSMVKPRLDIEPYYGAALATHGVSATFSATFSTTISATHPHVAEPQNISTRSMHSANSLKNLTSFKTLTTCNENKKPFERTSCYKLSKSSALRSSWKSSRLFRKIMNKRSKKSFPSLLKLEDIKLFVKSGSVYTQLNIPFSNSPALSSTVIDPVSMQQLLLSLIVTLNLIHLYTSSNVLTTYEYRSRQFLTLQQNRFIVDSTGEYYPASYRHELEQSYTLNFNTQNPDDAVKKFIYCFDESYTGLFPIKKPALSGRRYLNTDFDLTIPIDGLRYIHASDSPNNLLAVTSRAKWLENLKQPDFNTPINVYECIEAQISMKLGLSLNRYGIGFTNLLLYNSIVFDTLIQLRNIIRVDSTLRAKIHAYKMLPRLGMFTNYADFLLKRFFEGIIRIQSSIIESDSSGVHILHSESTTKTLNSEVGKNILMPMIIQHCKDLHDSLDILHKYEHTLKNLWTMRLTLLRHSYAEEDFLLMLQNECLRALSTSYGIPSEYFFALFSNIVNTESETKRCYMLSSMERVFVHQSDFLRKLRFNNNNNRTTEQKFTQQFVDNAYLRQQNVIRYFSLMEHDTKRIEAANRRFFVTIAELFALGKDPIGQLETILAVSPRTAGIYVLGPKFNMSQLLKQVNYTSSISPCSSLPPVPEISSHKTEEPSNFNNTIYMDLGSENAPSISTETSLSVTQDHYPLFSPKKDTRNTDTNVIFHEPQSPQSSSIDDASHEDKGHSEKTDSSSGIFSHIHMKNRRILTCFRENCPLFLIIVFYIVLITYLLLIYSYVLTNHLIAKYFLMKFGHISGMMAAFSDLRSEISMDITLQQTKNNPFEILSDYVERFNEIANNAYSAHTITSAMYNGLSVDDVNSRELKLSNSWPPPMLYYSGEQLVNPKDLLISSDYQSVTCQITMGTLSNKSIEALMNYSTKLPRNLSYIKLKLLPFSNLKRIFSGFNRHTQKRDFTQLQKSDIRSYLNIYSRFNIALYDNNFRKFINKHPITIPIVSSYPTGGKEKASNTQVNPHHINYFEATELLINRIVCIAASMIYISQQDSAFDPINRVPNEKPKLSLYRPIDSLMLEADLLQTVYQNTYINLQSIVINTWEIYSKYIINRLVLISFTLLAIGLFIPLHYLNFKRIQRRILRAKLDRACTLANILSLPPNVIESIMHNYSQAAMIPFKQFLWGNNRSSETDITLPREYYSDIYSYTQSKSIYNQTHFKLAELTTHSSKSIKNNIYINQHNDPDHSSRFYSHTDEISLVLRLVSIYNDISNNRIYILLYVFTCMVFFFFFAVNMIFPLHFRSPFVTSGLDISNYYGHWGNTSQFSFQLSVNGWDPAVIDQVQLAQQCLYDISKMTQNWAAPHSNPSSFAVDGHDLVRYMTGERAIEFATNKLYSPFYINKYMDNLMQTPFVYAFDYIRDHTKIMVSLLQWIDEVNFIKSASSGPSRCLSCTKMYYLLQYILKTSPVSLIYYVELLSHLSGISMEDFVESSYYLDFFIVHKRFLDVFSKIHDNLWRGAATATDISTIITFVQRYNYFANYNSTGLNAYDENAAIAFINTIPHNAALPSMTKKHDDLVRSLLKRLYGGPIIFSAILFLLFMISLIVYLVAACIFVYKSIVITIKAYNKISIVTQCACSIKYLMSCFMSIDLMLMIPILLAIILFMSVPVIYNAGVTMVSIFINYTTYNLSTEAILREDITFSHKLIPLSYKKFYIMQSVTNYLILLIFLLSSLLHHTTLRSRVIIDAVGYVRYTKEQEQELFNAKKNPFILSVREKITIHRPTNRSALEPYDDNDNDDNSDNDENKGNYSRIKAYFDLYDDYTPTNDDSTYDSGKNIGKTRMDESSDNPFLREKDLIDVTYNLPVFLPPLFIPKQKLEYVELLLRYSLIFLFVVSIHLLISASRLSDYTPKNISVAFLDQLIHNYNLLRAQLSQMYAHPAVSYKEPHLFINTFKYFRQLLIFLLANKYTQGVLSIPVQNMHVFKNLGIDNAFYEYGKQMRDFLQTKVYGYDSKVMELHDSTVGYDFIMPTTWMSGSSYYNAWSSLPPSNRSRLFIPTKIPDYHKDRFTDNSVLLPLYQKLLLFEYAYYQPNFANTEENLDNVLVRSITGTYGGNFANLSPEFKKIIFFDIFRNHAWVENLYCNHYLRMATTLLHSISVSQTLIELSVILLLIIIIAIVHITAHKLLLLDYNKKLTLYEVFTVLFLKRIRGLVN